MKKIFTVWDWSTLREKIGMVALLLSGIISMTLIGVLTYVIAMTWGETTVFVKALLMLIEATQITTVIYAVSTVSDYIRKEWVRIEWIRDMYGES